MNKEKIICRLCGKTKHKKDKNWFYFGTFNINLKTNKYFYRIIFDKSGNIKKLKDGMIATKKIKNKEYDKKAKPAMIDYWECGECFHE